MSLLNRNWLIAILALVFVAPAWADDTKKANDAVVPVPRDVGWMKRHESFNERVKKGNVDLLLIGDSITQGWEGSGAKVWKEFYEKRNAVNLGIGGDRTQHVLWRLDHGNIEGIKPKLAVLMIADGVKAIVEKLRTKLPETKVLVLGIFPRGENNDNKNRKVNAGANEIISKLADDKSVFYLDIGPKFLDASGNLSKEVMPDLLHLNEKSYRTWAESTEEMVKKLMGE
ncbi:MAG: GDSL family lipase [Planctomycetales bacterium]|nr:GDSL family lipase [Planctomycetales bacterium]